MEATTTVQLSLGLPTPNAEEPRAAASRGHRLRRIGPPPSPPLPVFPFFPRTQTLPFSASATFQSKSGRERGGRGAWQRRKDSFCSKSQEEEIHFLNTLPVAAPFFFFFFPPPLSFFFSANGLNERVASSAQNPFNVFVHIYIYLSKDWGGFKTNPRGPAVSRNHMQMLQSWAASFIVVLF